MVDYFRNSLEYICIFFTNLDIPVLFNHGGTYKLLSFEKDFWSEVYGRVKKLRFFGIGPTSRASRFKQEKQKKEEENLNEFCGALEILKSAELCAK